MANADGVICRGDTHEILSDGKRNTIGAALVMSEGEARLEQLERVIREGEAASLARGRAMREIVECELHRERGFASHAAYFRAQWGLSKGRVSQLINAAEVVDLVYKCKPELPPPANEGQARELAKLPPEQQPGAWCEAVETAPNGRVTAKHVRAVVKPLLPPKEPRSPAEGDDDCEDVWDAKVVATGVTQYLSEVILAWESDDYSDLEYALTSALERIARRKP